MCFLHPHLPPGHAAVILGSLLEKLRALSLLLLLQTALLLQLAELQLLKLLGPRLQSFSFLSTYRHMYMQVIHTVENNQIEV